ncbi:hypothetical protein GCM10007972_13740 [Iodidimonas muriae]|uniref:Uncharacterized protein n=1 Tax=Iodidimonas muriae TaxID=261467 RepID=A0ABQ2LD52_9PROT|nr:hypothetical protein JCM17843_17060 [Kordiimonadales bacterium JCM 17843]GGO10677.1 hypothetical protein GCM10007972_13740 [Iodidimonas muriae]
MFRLGCHIPSVLRFYTQPVPYMNSDSKKAAVALSNKGHDHKAGWIVIHSV